MRISFIAGILLAGVTQAAVAQTPRVPTELQGRWADTVAQCGGSHEASLTIRPDRVDFFESSGSVLSVKQITPSEIELEIELTGEGETWRELKRFVLSEDGRTLTDVTDGEYRFSRVRCD